MSLALAVPRVLHSRRLPEISSVLRATRTVAMVLQYLTLALVTLDTLVTMVGSLAQSVQLEHTEQGLEMMFAYPAHPAIPHLAQARQPLLHAMCAPLDITQLPVPREPVMETAAVTQAVCSAIAMHRTAVRVLWAETRRPGLAMQDMVGMLPLYLVPSASLERISKQVLGIAHVSPAILMVASRAPHLRPQAYATPVILALMEVSRAQSVLLVRISRRSVTAVAPLA